MNGLPRVDLHLTGDQVSIADMIRFGQAAEQAGLGAVWTAEAFRDSFTPLAALAGVTSRITLGTNIAQWTRSVPNLDLTAGDLQELSSGRFVLGLGSTTQQWNTDWHGIAYERPLQRMREYVEALRVLWTAGPMAPVSYDGEVFQIRDYLRFNGPLDTPIPVHLGASRAGMASLAGEIADGVNFNVLLSPDYLRKELLPAVARGAALAGREPGSIARGVLVITAVDDDGAQAVRWAKQQIAFYAGVANYFEAPLRFHGFDRELEAVQGACRVGDLPRAFELVTDEMAD